MVCPCSNLDFHLAYERDSDILINPMLGIGLVGTGTYFGPILDPNKPLSFKNIGSNLETYLPLPHKKKWLGWSLAYAVPEFEIIQRACLASSLVLRRIGILYYKILQTCYCAWDYQRF